MADGKKISPADLEMKSPKSRYSGLSLKEARESLEKEMILKALLQSKGNITKAATSLGVSRPTFYDLMEKFEMGNE